MAWGSTLPVVTLLRFCWCGLGPASGACFQPQNTAELKQAVQHWYHNERDESISRYGSISGWDTSLITDMSGVFSHLDEFNDDISGWDTSEVTNMSSMFHSASSFDQPIGNWDTSKVTDMSSMFHSASRFDQPIGNWDTTKVTDTTNMFENAISFSWDLCSLDPYPGSGHQFTDSNIGGAVGEWVNNRDAALSEYGHISDWDTSLVTTMSGLFYFHEWFNDDISGWDTSQALKRRNEPDLREEAGDAEPPESEVADQEFVENDDDVPPQKLAVSVIEVCLPTLTNSEAPELVTPTTRSPGWFGSCAGCGPEITGTLPEYDDDEDAAGMSAAV